MMFSARAIYAKPYPAASLPSRLICGAVISTTNRISSSSFLMELLSDLIPSKSLEVLECIPAPAAACV